MVADVITASRILFSCIMLFFAPKSVAFAVFYLLCGVSDMIDGTVARKMNTQSKHGEILDSISDLVFTITAAVKILPDVVITEWIIVWIILIAAVKFGNIIIGFLKNKRLNMPHTIANKITGLMLFAWGLWACYKNSNDFLICVCAAASFAALQEAYILLKNHQ